MLDTRHPTSNIRSLSDADECSLDGERSATIDVVSRGAVQSDTGRQVRAIERNAMPARRCRTIIHGEHALTGDIVHINAEPY